MFRLIPLLCQVRYLFIFLLLLFINGCAFYDSAVKNFADREYAFPCFDEPCRVFNALALQGNGDLQGGWFRSPGGALVCHARGFDTNGKIIDITCPNCILEKQFVRVHVSGYRVVGVEKSGETLNEAFLNSMMPIYWQRMFELQNSERGIPTGWQFLYNFFETRADEAVKFARSAGLHGESILAPRSREEKTLRWLKEQGVAFIPDTRWTVVFAGAAGQESRLPGGHSSKVATSPGS